MTILTILVGECELGYVAVFAAGGEELEEILEERDELVLALAVGEEEGEEDGEVARADHYLPGDIFCEFGRCACVVCYFVQTAHALE